MGVVPEGDLSMDLRIERVWAPKLAPIRQPAGGPKYNLRPTSTNSVRSNPLAFILDHPNPTLTTVALTVTFWVALAFHIHFKQL